MKKIEKILLVTVFLCILPVANLFALSQEAHQAIEAMRARILAEEKAQEAAVEETYVPGKELAAALERFREKFYSDSSSAPIEPQKAENEAEANDVTVPETEVVIEANADIQVIDQTDNEALNDIANNLADEVIYSFDNEAVKAELRKQNQEAIEAMRTRVKEREQEQKASTEEAPVASEEKAETATFEEAKPIEEEVTVAPTDDYVPGQLLADSVAKYREQHPKKEAVAEEEIEQAVVPEEEPVKVVQPQEAEEQKPEANDSYQTMEKANQEIEEIFNNPEKRAQVAEKGRKQVEARKAVQKKREKKAEKPKNKPKAKEESDESKQIDDERFNDYISRYNFKMPENYRIIVE